MSQAQLLTIVLGIIIVGIAVMMGIVGFGQGKKKANMDSLLQDGYQVAVDGIRWMRKPAAMGGGGDTCAISECDWGNATFEALGYRAGGASTYNTYNGEIEIDPTSNPRQLEIRVTNEQMANQVTITVTHSHPDSVFTVIDPEYAP